MSNSLSLDRWRVNRDADDLFATLKLYPQDFIVEELWQPEFSQEGEHLYLFVEKTGQNTHWVAEQLARAVGVSAKAVGFSGLKDRQSVSRQWFSLPVAADRARIEPDIEGVRILQRHRHSQKLRRGTHMGNHFQIRLRDLQGARDQLEQRLERIQQQGFPNYFGSQRFGHKGNNLRSAMQLARRRKLVGHPKRGIYLSALRSQLFNLVLAEHIEAGNWAQIVAANPPATGPMWGRGRPLVAEIDEALEKRITGENAELCDILEHGGLHQERRLLVQRCQDLNYRIEQDDLLLDFSLPPGSYATVLIDEILAVRDLSTG